MYKIIACNIFKKEVLHLANKNKLDDIIFLDQGLHNTPNDMREKLQQSIDEMENDESFLEKYKGIVLLYGLCGNGTVGLKTKKVELIIPRAHDCMTLFLGSKEKYREIIQDYRGVYWYNHAWIEQTPMPSKQYLINAKQEYYNYYDEENAEYLYEMEVNSLLNYKYGAFIESDIIKDEEHEEFVKEACNTFNWTYTPIKGCLSLIESVLSEKISEREFLILQPNNEVAISLNIETIVEGRTIN